MQLRHVQSSGFTFQPYLHFLTLFCSDCSIFLIHRHIRLYARWSVESLMHQRVTRVTGRPPAAREPASQRALLTG